jgi:hypothetical protein
MTAHTEGCCEALIGGAVVVTAGFRDLDRGEACIVPARGRPGRTPAPETPDGLAPDTLGTAVLIRPNPCESVRK